MIYTITGATGNLREKILTAFLKYIEPIELRVAVRTPEKAKKYTDLGVDV